MGIKFNAGQWGPRISFRRRGGDGDGENYVAADEVVQAAQAASDEAARAAQAAAQEAGRQAARRAIPTQQFTKLFAKPSAQVVAQRAAQEVARQAAAAEVAAQQAVAQRAAEETRQAAAQRAAQQAAERQAHAHKIQCEFQQIFQKKAQDVAQRRAAKEAAREAAAQRAAEEAARQVVAQRVAEEKAAQHHATRSISLSRAQNKQQIEKCLELALQYGLEAITSDEHVIFHLNDASINLPTRLFIWDLLAIMCTHIPQIHANTHARQDEKSLLCLQRFFGDQERYQNFSARMAERFNINSNGILPAVSADSKMPDTGFDLTNPALQTADQALRNLKQKAQFAAKKNQHFFMTTPESIETSDFGSSEQDDEFAAGALKFEASAGLIDWVSLPTEARARIRALTAANEKVTTQHTM